MSTRLCKSEGASLFSVRTRPAKSVRVRAGHKTAKNLCERDALPTELYPPGFRGRHVNAASALFNRSPNYRIRVSAIGMVELLLHVVNFHEADTDRVVLAANDCGVGSRIEVVQEDGG